MKKILNKLYQLQPLSEIESYNLFNLINTNKVNNVHLALILILIKMHGETIDEILGAVKSCIRYKKFFPDLSNYFFSDITGTGGDNKNNINVSTISAIVAATCGYKIVKHCNYAISGKFGSSNFLETLGINVHVSSEISKKNLEKFNICFLLAPLYYNSFKHAAKVRKTLYTRTLFNIIGPLLNPSSPLLTVIGVYKKSLMIPMITILKKLHYQRAILIHSANTDEITLHSKTYVTELKNKKIYNYQLFPKDFGLYSHAIKETLNYSFHTKVKDSINVLKGKGSHIHEEIIAVNVAILMKVFGNEDLKENTKYALKIIRSGQAYNLVNKLTSRN
ncbi:anthranilate phosphoribosyltransferase [Buchnera aphidicola (Nipponaphis monzeni)]|uniref:Anthranilate phosphoribosyltransferase n=1 Tax=Buchnera aphidicola (Nipponaphis monzeni) TaxID=2495405 RepID=A0A455TA68_9GAMM|nr:anthranilate phosphoribosyltransferase [Buchnera aphidicola]BBI01231.1 anthranilate phosphoribosyltransferase [Buchnera aphidicola (Nipponaphis monzeni)]